jgi:hypothetical protein
MLSSCGLRPSLGFIQVHVRLRWGSPTWLWHLMTAYLSPLQSNVPFSWDSHQESGGFILLKVFMYQSMGMT